ncbi:MAG: histidine kinase, partial [Bacteroidetes bacterium]|nr:histidine kinase [Bacteroidota bacterium]
MSVKKPNPAPPKSIQDFPIVGIGASAGGLEAFKKFLKAIPEDSGMAYVLVQHLDPSHESILPEILAKVTNIPVNEITDDIHLAPNHIYVIPQNKTLTSVDGVLKLTPRDKIIPHLPIDVFFTSLAQVHLSLAIGVVLSGTGKDGTLGLESIKEHGGITFAQDEDSSAYEGMPQNAINAEVVDFILPPEKIPEKLLRLIHLSKESENNFPKSDEAVFKKIILILLQRSGVDFTNYKKTTVHRRILRRMEMSKKEKLSDYLKILTKDKIEQDNLFQDMLIPVTSFFRDPEIFEAIGEKVFSTFFKNKSATEPIRIWVAGCSTGEEAYSFAISLHEHLGKKILGRQVQIFASDISESAISKARLGIYSKAELKNVSDEQIKKYFKKTDGGYQVDREIRDMCVFAVHNFLKDPPFAKMGLISCRNVLIYMDTLLQKKALSTFHYALKESGFLFLGKSETTGAESELFSPFAKNDKIYSRKAVTTRYVPIVKIIPQEEVLKSKNRKALQAEILQTDFKKITDTILLADYTPTSVVINDQMDIVHFHGIPTPFLEHTPGKPTLNLLKMAREGLSFELRNTLHKAKSTQAIAIKKGIPIKINGKQYLVTIKIIPLENTNEPHFLILFTKSLVLKRNTNKGLTAEKINHNEAVQRIRLEKELSQTREDMRSITEEQEAANEELQSANEELLSSSEELQSLNEELETSKEETQSSNEELMIVNQELLDKQEQIISSRQYAEAIIAAVREPLLVLDKYLRIKTANDSFYTKFNISQADSEGALIYEIRENMFDNSLLRSMLEKVLPQRSQLNDYEIIINQPPLGECTMLLNARLIVNEKNKEQLILIAIDDITERKISENRNKQFSEELQSKVKQGSLQLEQTNTQLDQFTH